MCSLFLLAHQQYIHTAYRRTPNAPSPFPLHFSDLQPQSCAWKRRNGTYLLQCICTLQVRHSLVGAFFCTAHFQQWTQLKNIIIQKGIHMTKAQPQPPYSTEILFLWGLQDFCIFFKTKQNKTNIQDTIHAFRWKKMQLPTRGSVIPTKWLPSSHNLLWHNRHLHTRFMQETSALKIPPSMLFVG